MLQNEFIDEAATALLFLGRNEELLALCEDKLELSTHYCIAHQSRLDAQLETLREQN